jgi:hypothetical protein
MNICPGLHALKQHRSYWQPNSHFANHQFQTYLLILILNFHKQPSKCNSITLYSHVSLSPSPQQFPSMPSSLPLPLLCLKTLCEDILTVPVKTLAAEQLVTSLLRELPPKDPLHRLRLQLHRRRIPLERYLLLVLELLHFKPEPHLQLKLSYSQRFCCAFESFSSTREEYC